MIILFGAAALVLLLVFGATIAWEATHPPRRTAGWAIANGRPVDPAEMGMVFSEWTLDRPGGVRLPVWEVVLGGDVATAPSPLPPPRERVAAPRGEGDVATHLSRHPPHPADQPHHGDALSRQAGEGRTTLVLLHGWGRSRIDSLGRLSALLAATPDAFDRAILPELRGHGEASEHITRLADGEDADVLELLRRIGAPSYIVAGHSMGAVVAILAAASDDPIATRIRGVIAWAPYTEVHVPIRNRLRARDVASRPFTDVALLLLRLVGVRRRRTIPAAARLPCPLLVIGGDRDIVSPLDGAEAIAEAAPGGTLVVLAGAHPNVHECSPGDHAAAVREFLGGVLHS